MARDTAPGKNWHDDQKMAPGLAERWERPGNCTYIFHPRRNVTRHDGQPFSAADVVHSVQVLKDTGAS